MDRPILMSAPMVLAVLAGRKSQTRRLVKPQPGQAVHHGYARPDGDFTWCLETGHGVSDRIVCPFGRAGDRLWVRESFRKIMGDTHGWIETDYRATYVEGSRLGEHFGVKPKWTPSIHMPRCASRITLKITDVRAEQLQAISADDAAAEGWPGPDAANTIRNGYPIAWYSLLWDQINGRRHPWASNPWVFAIHFEVVK